MFNRLCEWFVRHYIPSDKHVALADALFDFKYKS